MKIYLLFIISLLNFSVYSQQWDWAKSGFASSSESPNCIETDVNGNIYMSGTFDGSIVFDSITLNTNGSSDIFIVKYNPAGNVLWAKGFGGTGMEMPNALTTDVYGNVYVGGEFRSASLSFDSYQLLNDTVFSGNIFLAKLDQNGNVIYAKGAGGDGAESISSLSSDVNGNIYITGIFFSSSFDLGTITLYNAGSIDGFIAKADQNGNYIWVKSISNSGYSNAIAASSDVNGNVFVVGTFSDSLMIGIDTFYYSGGYTEHIYIIKLDSNGIILWANEQGGGGMAYPSSVAVNSSGEIYIGGVFRSPTIVFGSDTLVDYGYPQGYEMFLAKYDSNGNVIWAKRPDDNYAGRRVVDIGIDAAGDIYLAANYKYKAVYGNDTLSRIMDNHIPETFLDPPRQSKFFVAKFSGNGNYLWGESIGTGNDDDEVFAATCDMSGNVYLCGIFNSYSLQFGSNIIFNSNPVYFYWNWDMYVAKISSLTTATQNIDVKYRFTIYPNPSSGIFTIDLGNCRDAKICVYDVLGSCLVKKDCLNDVSPKIDLGCQPKGIYFMEIVSKGERAVKKIVVQ